MDENKRKKILRLIKDRDRRQSKPFAKLLLSHTKLQENVDFYRDSYWQIKGEKESLQQQMTNAADTTPAKGASGNKQDLRSLEKRMEELIELTRKNRPGNNEILDLNVILMEKENRIKEIKTRLTEKGKQIEGLQKISKDKDETIIHLERRAVMLQDENSKAKQDYTAVRKRLHQMCLEKNELFNQLHELRNGENINIDFPEEDLDDGNTSSDSDDGSTSSLPGEVIHDFLAHEGEVNAVRWNPSGRMFASGSRSVRLWEVTDKKCYCTKTLPGEEGMFMSLEFNKEGDCMVAATNVGHICMWSLPSYTKQPNLLGHFEKVMAAKFLGTNKVASGSYDRTVRIWDLKTGACTTRYATSACNDLITLDGHGTNFITGHWDRNIRFWDERADTPTKEIVLNGAITSLDLSPDNSSLLACSRDHTLKVIDLRMTGHFKVLCTLSTKGFQVACDWARAVFGPDGRHAVVGSHDGSLYVWNIHRREVAKELTTSHKCSWSIACRRCSNYIFILDLTPGFNGLGKDNRKTRQESFKICDLVWLISEILRSGVVACSWHLSNNYMVTCDRSRRAVIWKCS